jgi:hypothetical protein
VGSPNAKMAMRIGSNLKIELISTSKVTVTGTKLVKLNIDLATVVNMSNLAPDDASQASNPPSHVELRCYSIVGRAKLQSNKILHHDSQRVGHVHSEEISESRLEHGV